MTHRPLDINFNSNNTTKDRNNNHRSLEPHIYNSLPSEIKDDMEYEKFKKYMNDWCGLKCNCNMCYFLNVWIILNSFDYCLGRDLFNYVTV